MLKEILFKQFSDIRREEWPRALLLSAYFFLVIATYWVLKPIKRSVIINYFGDDPLRFMGMSFSGAEAEQFAKALNLVVVYFVVLLFTWLARRVPRHHLVTVFAALFGGIFAFFAGVINNLTPAIVWSFYILGDMFNTTMVALFWAFTNDIAQVGEAKRTYGIIGLGGVVGGFLGATLVETCVENYGRTPLLLACVVPMLLIIGIAFVIHHRAAEGDPLKVRQPAASPGKKGAGVALEGARMVLSSKYLLAIAGTIACYEVVSNIIDFQLAATIERIVEPDLEKDSFFAMVGQFTGLSSIFVQLFLTSFVLRKFGIRVGLFFLPVAIFLTSSGFLFLPLLYAAAVMSISDNSLNYSINQSAREALYTPTSPDVTYKAKAFIDMFVQRMAKVLSVALNLVISSVFVQGVRWLSLLTLCVAGIWFFLVRIASQGFGRRILRQADAEEMEDDPDVKAALEEQTQG